MALGTTKTLLWLSEIVDSLDGYSLDERIFSQTDSPFLQTNGPLYREQNLLTA